MIILYILIIVLAAIPLWKTVRYIQLEKRIREEGINTSGVVTYILTSAMRRGSTYDRVHIEYASNITGHVHQSIITAKHKKFKLRETVPIKYLPEEPSKIVVDGKHSHWAMLIFSILIFIFMLFAVYKIDEMIKTGNI